MWIIGIIATITIVSFVSSISFCWWGPSAHNSMISQPDLGTMLYLTYAFMLTGALIVFFITFGFADAAKADGWSHYSQAMLGAGITGVLACIFAYATFVAINRREVGARQPH